VVQGTILDSRTCKAIPNAKIAHWQAGENSQYKDSLYAYMFADKKGGYKFTTEWPSLNPPHIYFIVTAKGDKTIETQWRGGQRQKNSRFDIVLVPVDN